MKTKEKFYTEEDAYEHALAIYNKMIKAKKKSLALKVYNQCKEGGKKQKGRKQLKSLRTLELQFEYLKDHPNTPLPVPELDHSETVEAWNQGIKDYKHDVENGLID